MKAPSGGEASTQAPAPRTWRRRWRRLRWNPQRETAFPKHSRSPAQGNVTPRGELEAIKPSAKFRKKAITILPPAQAAARPIWWAVSLPLLPVGMGDVVVENGGRFRNHWRLTVPDVKPGWIYGQPSNAAFMGQCIRGGLISTGKDMTVLCKEVEDVLGIYKGRWR